MLVQGLFACAEPVRHPRAGLQRLAALRGRFALLADSKAQLWAWKAALRERLGRLYGEMQDGAISFGDFDASAQGWINPIRQADSAGLRAHVLAPFVLPAGAQPQFAGRRR